MKPHVPVVLLLAWGPACLPPPPPDGGPDRCEVALECEDAASETLRFDVDGTPALVRESDGLRLVLGQARREDVQAALGFGVDEGGNPFRQNHCELGLQLQYVDDVLLEEYDGSPNGDDVLARVTTLPGGRVEIATSMSTVEAGQGDSAETLAQTLSLDAPLDRAGLGLRLGPPGLTVLELAGEVEQIAISVLPGDEGRYSLAVNLDTGDLGSGGDRITTRDSRFSELRALLGDPTAEGVADSDLLLVDARVATWPALGVRVAGACPVLGACDENTSVTSILLSSPFFGTAEAGLGLFSEKEAFDDHFGSDGTDVDGVIVYSGTTDLGVIYATFGDCTERAVGLILDYRVAP